MNRLMKKDEYLIGGYCPINYSIFDQAEIFKKLGQYEDIEEMCNIDIIKSIELCKKVNAQKKVYIKENWGIDEIKFLNDLDVELFHHRLYLNSRGIYISLDINEFGISWALTKEELEKEKEKR